MSNSKRDPNDSHWKDIRSEFSAHVPAPSPEKTKLGRFFRKVSQIFQRESHSEIKLKGRIHELQKNADLVLNDLLNARQELKNEIDPSLFAHLESVVDPLIKEASRIQKETGQKESASEYMQIFKRYIAWIEKAKMWVELCSKRNKKETISKAVIDHNIHEFNMIVDKDLQIINDYFSHLLDHYQMEEGRRLELKKKLEQEIGTHIRALQELQQKPQDLTLGDLSSWRREFDQRREKHYSAALHAIDVLMQKENPTVFDEEESEHYIDILKRMATLEEKISSFSNIDHMESTQKKLACNQLSQVEEEAHHLNADLRLSQETSERLQSLMQQIVAIREKLEA